MTHEEKARLVSDLRLCREAAGLSVREFAAAIGVAASSWRTAESVRSAGDATLDGALDVLGWTREELRARAAEIEATREELRARLIVQEAA